MNLTPAHYPLTLERGTKTTFSFLCLETATGPAIDLTGATFEGRVRRSYSDRDNSLSFELPITITDPLTGAWEFTIDDTAFGLIPAALTSGVYDILWLLSSGEKPKIMRGPVTINGTATRDA